MGKIIKGYTGNLIATQDYLTEGKLNRLDPLFREKRHERSLPLILGFNKLINNFFVINGHSKGSLAYYYNALVPCYVCNGRNDFLSAEKIINELNLSKKTIKKKLLSFIEDSNDSIRDRYDYCQIVSNDSSRTIEWLFYHGRRE